MVLEPLTRLAIGHRGSIGIVAVTTNLPDSNSDKVPGLRYLVLSKKPLAGSYAYIIGFTLKVPDAVLSC